MNRLENWKKWLMLTVAVAVVMVAEHQLAQSKTLYGYVVAAILSLSAALLSEKIIQLLFKVRGIRKLIMGSKYVEEGHWLLETPPANDDDISSPILKPGVLCMEYDDETSELGVKTTRIEGGQQCTTMSIVAHIRATTPHVAYLNFFKLSSHKYEPSNGFSYGIFPKTTGFFRKPHSFEADLSIQNEGFTRKQFGHRIPDSVVKAYHKEFDDSWITIYLSTIEAATKSNDDQERAGMLSVLEIKRSSQTKKHRGYLELLLFRKLGISELQKHIANH